MIVDTAGFIHWPHERLRGCTIASSQLREIERHSPSNHLLIDQLEINILTPESDDLRHIENLARSTGDINGLSPVDIDVLAVAVRAGDDIATDDHRVQNVAESAGIAWVPVIGKGISEKWNWVRKCRGCGRIWPNEPGIVSDECSDCGSKIRLVRK